MGHRHLSNLDLGQNQRHAIAGQSYNRMGRSLAPDTSSFVYPSQNIQTSRLHTSSFGYFGSRQFEHSSSFRIGAPSRPGSLSGPTSGSNPYIHVASSFYPAAENNVGLSHSSHGYRNGVHEVERGLPDHAMSAVRGSFKRKRSDFTMTSERGSSYRYYNTGNPSSSSAEFQLDKRTGDYQNYLSSSNGFPEYRFDSYSTQYEVPPRNVRIQSELDWEPDSRRTYFPRYPLHYQCPSANPFNHPGTVVNANIATYDHNHLSASSAGNLHIPGTTGFRHGSERHLVGRSTEYIPAFCPASAPPYPHRLYTQSAIYSHSDVPPYRAGLRSAHMRQNATTAEISLHFPALDNSTGYTGSITTRGWHGHRRDIDPLITAGRSQPLSISEQARHRMVSEELRRSDHSLFDASMNLFDQHGDMRLDTDGMSYEELLDLGERIGNVSTGLSKDEISTCLVKTIYPSKVGNTQDAICAICLEDYKRWERIGALKTCDHNYHAECIEKWLSIKNVCPICKAPARAHCPKEGQ